MSAAAEKLEQRRRGWTTEEDKKMKIFNLPKVNKAFRNTSWFFENSYVMDFKLCLVISSCNYMEDDQCKGCRLIFQKDTQIHFPSFIRIFAQNHCFVYARLQLLFGYHPREGLKRLENMPNAYYDFYETIY